MYGYVDFTADEDIWEAFRNVSKEIESEDHRAIGGVFERNDALTYELAVKVKTIYHSLEIA